MNIGPEIGKKQILKDIDYEKRKFKNTDTNRNPRVR